MTPDEFRRYGHAVVDWIADYQSRIESFPSALAGEARADSRFAARRILRHRVNLSTTSSEMSIA